MVSHRTGIPDTKICTIGTFLSYLQGAAALNGPKHNHKGKPPLD